MGDQRSGLREPWCALSAAASCGRRGVRSWVCDPDGVISYQSANVVEGLIKKIVMGEAPYARDACGRCVEGY